MITLKINMVTTQHHYSLTQKVCMTLKRNMFMKILVTIQVSQNFIIRTN